MPDSLFSSMAQNLSAELVGIIVTVVWVENWAKRREAKRLRPVLRSAHRDLREIYLIGMRLVEKALTSAATLADVPLLNNPNSHVLSSDVGLIFDRLHVDQKMNQLELTRELTHWTWRAYLPHWGTIISGQLNAFLERYAGVVEPDLYAAVHSLKGAMLVKFTTNTAGVLALLKPQGRIPQTFPDLAERLRGLRDEIRKLETTLGLEHADGYQSHEMFPRVVAEIERHPTACPEAPYRPD